MLALYLFGGEVLHGFAFTMLVGIVTGTYSSVFIAGGDRVDLAGEEAGEGKAAAAGGRRAAPARKPTRRRAS